jgi:hypothetical protein
MAALSHSKSPVYKVPASAYIPIMFPDVDFGTYILPQQEEGKARPHLLG